MMKSIESIKSFSIVYTNHEATLKIFKQTTLTTFSIDKLNLRIVRVFNNIQKFHFIIRHKSEKRHIISDAFSRLLTTKSFDSNYVNEELKVLFVTSMIKMNSDLKKRLLNKYVSDFD